MARLASGCLPRPRSSTWPVRAKAHLSGWQSRIMLFTVDLWSFAAGSPASLIPHGTMFFIIRPRPGGPKKVGTDVHCSNLPPTPTKTEHPKDFQASQ